MLAALVCHCRLGESSRGSTGYVGLSEMVLQRFKKRRQNGKMWDGVKGGAKTGGEKSWGPSEW